MLDIAPKKGFYLNLEALRGFAANTVAIGHCFGFSLLLNGVQLNQGIWGYQLPGHFAVLLFFILSGYVIGIASKQLSWQTIGAYLKKRFLRLYPIYVLAILITLGITHHDYSLLEVFSNLTFMQRVASDCLYEVGANWSLNYEVLFYLLFIPVSIYALKPSHVFAGALLSGLFFQFVASIPLLAMYGYGFCFWLTGLWLAQNTQTVPKPTSYYTLAGLLMLMLSFSSLNLVREVLHFNLNVDYMRAPSAPYGAGADGTTAIMPSDFSYLPLGILMITYFTDKRLRFGRFLLAFVLAVPPLYLLFQLYYSRTHVLNYEALVLPTGFYFGALVLLLAGRLRPATTPVLLPGFMITLGGLSYSIYLIHFIFIVLVGRVAFLKGSNLSFGVRLATVLLLTLAVSYCLEKVWQPFAMRQLKKLRLFQDPRAVQYPIIS